uniref:Protein BCCIP homolog n=1 Tax=Ciona intestinalis TaxID=7719 RepID=A0A1W5B6R5_CIOIN|nr:protein BCCIP homolog isoform X1 [Ciona intestinalis]XP_026690839.1 protein BCCIP homolog isoform X1 [Ciona intestinalis]|eukprot:XP_002126595.1 protein BCCIP homolog isoform X1 [Ciona intestinalis]
MSKKSKEDPDVSSSDEGEDGMMMVEDGEKVDVDFEGFPLSDSDFDGIRQLLTQLLSSSVDINLSKLTESLIGQNFVGTVLKQSETGSEAASPEEDEVFALVTCLPIIPQDELQKSIVKHFISKCKSSSASSETKKEFTKILQACAEKGEPTGFLINERFINVPSQAALPMFEKLFSELESAKNSNHKANYNFTHYVIICKICRDFATQDSDTMYMNAEEEIFAEESLTSFDYQIPTDDVMKTRRVLLLTKKNFERSFEKLKSVLAQ